MQKNVKLKGEGRLGEITKRDCPYGEKTKRD